ncbi:MAG TPA: OmpA family protein [Acidiferrobacterales bacterium]|nr:OmpA family protein [Acidiferrobacterales bacterium]
MNNTSTRQQVLLLAVALVLGTIAMEVDLSAAITGYLTDQRAAAINSGTGLCRYNSSWTPATVECDPDRVPAMAAAPAASAPAADTLFDVDKSVITPKGKATLDDLVSKLGGNLRVIIPTGDSNNPGGDAYNMDLSQHRAEAVKAYLVGKGLDGNRIYTAGTGERDPITANKTAEGPAEIEVMATSK